MTTDKPKKQRKRMGRFGKVYASILTSRKLANLMAGKNGHKALALWSLGLAWTAEHLTDGFIPKAVLPTLHGTPVAARALVEARFWTEVENGWQYVDYETAGLTKAESDEREHTGRVRACEGWMKKGKPCSCGTHTEPLPMTA